ncbi:unnamed protein product [Linum tenue]|uniref:Glutamine amidotransferase domain-containing protein n=1 Tax=Linum tenue TaxID=586396 RepID=A0AAV0M5W9_9ROSI|nr:unnamed protein product [Linum tenue]
MTVSLIIFARKISFLSKESPRILEYVCKTVLELGPIVPLFCVCMGLQCFGEAFGGKIVRSPFGSMHGKSSPVYYDEKGKGLFTGLPKHFHLKTSFFPHDLEPSFFPPWVETLQGVQFHPESIITSEGKIIVQNFLKMIEEKEAESTN